MQTPQGDFEVGVGTYFKERWGAVVVHEVREARVNGEG